MYTDIKTILDDANKNNYAVLAASAFNMELARGLIAAADEMQAPLIILMGQAQMTKHARPELMVPMIKTLAEQTNVPVALILDHGRDWEKITWAYRQGFSSIMVDASAYDMEENIARTKKAVELCHVQGLAVEGELGHVGRHSGRMRRVAVHKAGGSRAICAGDRGGQPGHCLRHCPWGLSQRLYPHH